MAYAAIAGFFILVIVGGVGLGVASATSVDDVARSGAFGFSEAAQSATTLPKTTVAAVKAEDEPVFYERSALASVAPRDLSSGMQMIDEMERVERERKAAEDATVIDRMTAMRAKQGIASSNGSGAEYGLSDVDWTVGREAFVSEWGSRIDAYLAGSPLEGYGAVFAEAAWVNGVDPRWSPAISNTESSKGTSCFLPYNAWGWGSSCWDDWESAIREHVAGLANGYGYSITVSAAQAYCPPNWSNWYSDTLDQMSCI